MVNHNNSISNKNNTNTYNYNNDKIIEDDQADRFRQGSTEFFREFVNLRKQRHEPNSCRKTQISLIGLIMRKVALPSMVIKKTGYIYYWEGLYCQ
jgi:hypothetical protein